MYHLKVKNYYNKNFLDRALPCSHNHLAEEIFDSHHTDKTKGYTAFI